MQRLSRYLLMTAGFLAFSASQAHAGDLRLTIANGRVTLVAHDVSVRQILDEWSRVGQTRIVNGDKLIGPPITLELTDVPEAKALESILRSAAGYILAPRTGAGPSVYDRIMILATSRPPAPSAAPPPPFNRAMPQPMPATPVDDEDDDGREPIMPPGMVPPPGPQPFPGAPPQTQPGMPQAQPVVPGQPGQPGQQQPMTAPRPGMLPAPTIPGNPYQPQQPPVRPPGGGEGI